MEENKSNEVSSEKSKKRRFPVVIVIILLLLLFLAGIGIGILFGMTFEKTSDNNQNSDIITEPIEEPMELEELKEEDITPFKTVINFINMNFADSYPLDATKISNQDVLYLAWIAAREEKKISSDQDFSKEQMREFVSYMFGADFVYQDEDIICFGGDGALYQFDGSMYHRGGLHAHDGKPYYRAQSYFVAGSKNDAEGTMEIQAKVLYGGKCGGTCGPVGKYYKTAGSETDVLYTPNDPTGATFDSVYQQYQNQLPITTYVFKKDSAGNYGLQSVRVS